MIKNYYLCDPIFFMPTQEQLSKIWASQFEYFGGAGQPMQTYGQGPDENGLTTPQHTDIPVSAKFTSKDYEGEFIGTISYDPEKRDLKLEIPCK